MQSEDQRATSTSLTNGSQDSTRNQERRTVSTSRLTERRVGDRRNPRNLPASLLTPPAPPPSPHLDDYEGIVGRAQIDALRFLAHQLKGKTMKMVNSTAMGG